MRKHGKVAYFPFTMNLKGTNSILIEIDEDDSLNERWIIFFRNIAIRFRKLEIDIKKKNNLE